MRNQALLFSWCLLVGAATLQAAPPAPAHHVWSDSGPLTSASSDAPVDIAKRFIAAQALEFGVPEADLASVYLVKQYKSVHSGITHLVFRQQYGGYDVHGSEYTVNVDASGQVLNAGGTLYARPSGPAPTVDSAVKGIRAAVREVNPASSSSYLPAGAAGGKTTRFLRGGFAEAVEAQPVWYPAGRHLRAGWAFFVPGPDGHMYYRAIVDSETDSVVNNTRLGSYQAPQPPRGLVFGESPQPDPKPGVLGGVRPYVQRTLESFTGDPQASPKGWVDGTETAGNNTITGHNPLGTFDYFPVTTKSPTRDFSFPLQLGPGAPNPTNFKDAATTNLFYWINKTHDFLWHGGFDEPSGAFQIDNFGRGGEGNDPIYAYSQFGIARPGFALIDNSSFAWRGSTDDGFPGYVRMYLSGDHANNIFADGSYDAAVIIHEYAHGLSMRLAREVYETYQGRAMAEAWSDYVAFELLQPEGLRPDGAYVQAEYLFQRFGSGDRSRPTSTDMNINGLTFADYGRVTDDGLEEHWDGEIWMQALWDVRANLIQKFGEREARRRMLRIVIEGMKLQPPRAGMVEARDAIILANRALYKAEGEPDIWRGFAKRGLGVLAHSRNGNSSYVVASDAIASDTGVLQFHSKSYVPGEMVRLVLYDANNPSPTTLVQITTSSGDRENITMRKRGAVYLGEMLSFEGGFVRHRDESIDLIPGDFISAYYLDANTGAGPKLIEATVPVQPRYTFTEYNAAPPFISGAERPLFSVPTGGRFFLTHEKVNLPWNFRFFDRTYRSIYVSGNGVITFGGPNPTTCNDSDSVASVPAIAPMWTELLYGGRSQNVYVSLGLGTVKIRWAAETAYTGEPVNVSATLFDNGRILFQYGPGNNNLVSSTQFGCNTNTPVVGISAGRDSYQLRYGDYDGLPILGNFPAVMLEPPFDFPSVPVIRIESPEPSSSHSGVLTVKGIVYDPEKAIARVDLLIDGVSRGPLPINESRPDICNAERLPGCPLIGFVRNVDLASFRIQRGTHTLQIRATNVRGGITTWPEQPLEFTFAGGEGRLPVAVVELPAEGATLSRITPIRGYAYAPDLRVTAVAILIDGVNYGMANYGIRRDDVCNAIPAPRPPNCSGVGFQFNLNTVNGNVQLPNGEHDLQVRITDESGRMTTVPQTPIKIRVENAENPGAIGQITSPSPNARLSGTVKVTGWAYDPNGSVASVELFVGLRSLGLVRHGLPAPEACAALTSVPACPNIGFETELNTNLLSNGQHLLFVRIRDNNGRSTILPTPTYAGMPVNVAN